jgi:hypothetical protein
VHGVVWKGFAALALVMSSGALPSAGAERSADSTPDAGVAAGAADGGPADAGPAGARAAEQEPGAQGTGGSADPCSALEARLDRRRSWLAQRRQEQFALGGAPDPSRGISNAVGIWCQAHPGDEECALGGIAVSVSSDELTWSPQSTPEDFDPHVILMRRAVRQCKDEQARRR